MSVKRYDVEALAEPVKRYEDNEMRGPDVIGEWERHADAQAQRDADKAEIARLQDALEQSDATRFAVLVKRILSGEKDLNTIRAALSLPADATSEAMVERAKRLDAFVADIRSGHGLQPDESDWHVVRRALATLQGGRPCLT